MRGKHLYKQDNLFKRQEILPTAADALCSFVGFTLLADLAFEETFLRRSRAGISNCESFLWLLLAEGR